jgi:LemA protein
MLKKILIVLPVIVVMAVAAASKFTGVHSDLAGQRQAVAAQWSHVESALKSRADLVPSLVQTVNPRRDPGISESIVKACQALAGGRTTQEKIQANDQLSAALSRLLLAAENYPKLRSNETYLRLQDEIADSENRIAIERRKYNEILEHYNAQIQRFPDNVVASLSGFTRNDAYFQTDGANGGAPKLQF